MHKPTMHKVPLWISHASERVSSTVDFFNGSRVGCNRLLAGVDGGTYRCWLSVLYTQQFILIFFFSSFSFN